MTRCRCILQPSKDFFLAGLLWSMLTHGLVVKASSSESGDIGSIPAGWWNSRLHLCHFAWHWDHQCTDTPGFILLHSLFFSLGFRQWQLLTWNLTFTVWSTWSQARGPDSATFAGVAHQRDYSFCIASEQRWQRRLGHWFSLNYRKYLKKSGPHWGFFNLHPPDW